MKVVSTYKEYLKACKEVDDTSVYAWMPKVSYVVDTLAGLNNLLSEVEHKTLKKIIKEIIDNYNKEFYYGMLVGIELTNEDYYYVYKRFDKRVYDSCVGGLKKININNMEIQEFDHYFLTNGLKCHWNFWLLPKAFMAITLFGHIFFNMSKDELYKYLCTKRAEITINHEKIHTIQAESFKTKYLGFYIYYLYYWVKNLFKYGVKGIEAYRNIPFEREARDKELFFEYNETNWRKYI